MREQQQRQQQQQQKYRQQQKKKQNQQAGNFNIPKVPKYTAPGNVSPKVKPTWNQVQPPNQRRVQKRPVAQIISNILTMALIGFVLVVIFVVWNLLH